MCSYWPTILLTRKLSPKVKLKKLRIFRKNAALYCQSDFFCAGLWLNSVPAYIPIACYLETVVIVVKDLGCDNKTCK